MNDMIRLEVGQILITKMYLNEVPPKEFTLYEGTNIYNRGTDYVYCNPETLNRNVRVRLEEFIWRRCDGSVGERRKYSVFRIIEQNLV